MTVNEILENGLIEGYVLGILEPDEMALIENAIAQNPTLRHEINAVEFALQKYLTLDVQTSVKDKLNNQINFVEEEKERLLKGDFNFINKNSDAALWRKSIEHLLPKEQEPFFITSLRDDEVGELFLIKSFVDVENEVHENEVESFMVLEGTCTCYIGNKKYDLIAGDFIEIPLYTDHDIKITSDGPVIAIMQRLKLKAG